jgi:hypothetical protein
MIRKIKIIDDTIFKDLQDLQHKLGRSITRLDYDAAYKRGEVSARYAVLSARFGGIQMACERAGVPVKIINHYRSKREEIKAAFDSGKKQIAVAKMFGVTREAARQWYVKIYGQGHRERVDAGKPWNK